MNTGGAEHDLRADSGARTSIAEASASNIQFFNSERLVLARQLRGLTARRLADLISLSQASISSWERGTGAPSAASIKRLADVLQFEPRFFMGGDPSDITSPRFRSTRQTSAYALKRAEAYGRVVAEIAGMLDNSVGLPPLRLPSIPVRVDDSESAATNAARSARNFFGLPPGPIDNVIRSLEDAGVVVVFDEIDAPPIDAYSFHSGTRAIIILNPEKGDYYRQRFDVAHELGHLIMHRDVDRASGAIETQADQFAAEFLAPASEIWSDLRHSARGPGWSSLINVKETWGVSLAALLRRSRELGAISEVAYRNAMLRMRKHGWVVREPGRMSVPELPSLLARGRIELHRCGIEDDRFLSGSGLPKSLYLEVTSRMPAAESQGALT